MWHARDWERKRTKKEQQDKEAERITEKINVKEIYGKRLTDPILGNYFKLPQRTFKRHDFELDTSFAYVSTLSLFENEFTNVHLAIKLGHFYYLFTVGQNKIYDVLRITDIVTDSCIPAFGDTTPGFDGAALDA